MKLTNRIHLLQIDFEISISPGKIIPRFVNVVLIFGEKIALIDTGVKGSEAILFDYIKQQGRNPLEIDTVILSHAHPDHIGSAAAIKELTECRILAHELEKEWIENIELQCRQRPVPGFFNLVDRPVEVDECLLVDQTLRLGSDLSLHIYKSAGHSKGSLNILFEEDRVLFTADSIPLKNDIPNYDSYPDLMKSLEVIKSADYDVLLTSWTTPLNDKENIDKLIREGEDYLKRIDGSVRECYKNKDSDTLDACKLAVEQLGLQPFLVNPIVDKAFKSHLCFK